MIIIMIIYLFYVSVCAGECVQQLFMTATRLFLACKVIAWFCSHLESWIVVLLASHCGNLASLSSWDGKREPCKSENIDFWWSNALIEMFILITQQLVV